MTVPLSIQLNSKTKLYREFCFKTNYLLWLVDVVLRQYDDYRNYFNPLLFLFLPERIIISSLCYAISISAHYLAIILIQQVDNVFFQIPRMRLLLLFGSVSYNIHFTQQVFQPTHKGSSFKLFLSFVQVLFYFHLCFEMSSNEIYDRCNFFDFLEGFR